MSSTGFFELLEKRVQEVNSLLCVGLDPHTSQLSEASAVAAENFCKEIIDATLTYAAAFKPNIAFFEALGHEGMIALQRVISYIPPTVPVILDCKRGDIDTTAQAYAQAAFNDLQAGAVTLSPYMGWDSIKPFVTGQYANKGAFVLCKTSNPSSKDIQEQRLRNDDLVYQQVSKLCVSWNAQSNNLGLVAGATDLSALKSIREIAEDIWILCPGVGAQGGDANSVCNVGLRGDGSGLLIAVSRAISSAPSKSHAAESLRDEINGCRKSFLSHLSQEKTAPMPSYKREFIEFALAHQALKFGSFTLKSGRTSPYFFNAGLFHSGQSMAIMGKFYAQAIRNAGIEFDVIFGPAYKGIPLATTVSIAWYHLYGENKDVCYNRKEAKDHGEGGNLVGASMTGKRVLIVDDVITAGTAIRESVDILKVVDAILVGVAVSLDRQEKVSEQSDESAIQAVQRSLNVGVISIIQLRDLLQFLESSSTVDLSTYLPLIKAYRDQYGVAY